MIGEQRSWAAYGVPVIAAIAILCVLNGLWSLPSLALYDRFPHSLCVYVPTCLLCLAFLWRAGRSGLLTRNEAGLCLQGWTPWKRLLALGVTLFMGLGGYSALPAPLETPDAVAEGAAKASGGGNEEDPELAAANAKKPSWGDYCFWWVFLLSASLVELLVFASIGFCLTEKYMTSRGFGTLTAVAVAAIFAAVAFGLYHYTHPPRWWGYVWFPLVPVMLINLAVFAVTRNFYLTLLLHNSFAAVGFTGEQWADSLKQAPEDPMLPERFLNPGDPSLAYILTAFVVPFVILHVVEAVGFKSAGPARQES